MLVSSILDDLARDLNDFEAGHEFTTWSRHELFVWLQEGMELVFAGRPDLFSEEVIIKAQPCTNAQDICECEYITRVIGQVTKDGRLLNRLNKESQDQRDLWIGRDCSPRDPNKFRLNSYSISTKSNKLYLYPTIPYGLDVYVLVECAARPDSITEDEDISGDIATAAKQWVLYRALAKDAENNPAVLNMAAKHEDSFYRVLGLQKSAQDIINRSSDD